LARVLLVEDNAANSEMLLIILHKLGHEATVAESAEVAISLLLGDKPRIYDCVLMDVKLPGIDGMEATRQLRRGGLIELPIIALTAQALAGDREKCLDSGMNDYLSKPVTVDLLRNALDRWV
jgi:two-component system, sensor histidine kinase and response regulator